MDETQVAARIRQLANEEHELFSKKSSDRPMTDDDHRRLRALEVELDQCYDLLRQRRARRAAGLDPNEAEVRDPNTVERYQQ